MNAYEPVNGGATTEANPTGTPPFGQSVQRVLFEVVGLPKPQGSKTMVAPNVFRESSRGLPAWRNAIADKAAEAMKGRAPLAGPLRLDARFTFPRPLKHYRTGRHAGELKPDAPFWQTDRRDDLDKLVRAVGDALAHGGVVVDDGMLCVVYATKCYGAPTGVLICVQEIAP